MVAYTTTYSFAKPTVGDDEDVWGGLLNGNFDSIENLLKGTTALSALKVTGVLSVGNSSPKTWHSNSAGVIQFGGVGALENYNATDDVVTLSANVYRASDGTFKYIETNEATRFYQYAGDMAFQTASSGTANTAVTLNTRLFIKNDGNIGIGTSSPSADLHIQTTSSGSNNNALYLHNNATAASTSSTLRFANSTDVDSEYGQSKIVGIRTSSDGTSNLVFHTSNAGTLGEAMRIGGDGSVGIGASAYVPLMVQAAGSSSAGENTHLRINDTTNMAAGVGGVIQLSGEAISGDATQYTFATIKGIKENGTSGDYDGALTFSTRTNGASPAVERMRISSDGNVGVGTSSPSSYQSYTYFDVFGKSSTQGGIFKTSTSDGGTQALFYTTNTQTIIGPTANVPFSFMTNNSERMRISNTGSVGIGTTSPSSALHVNGLGIFEDGLRIGTGNGHGTAGRATISFGESSPTTDTFLIEYDGENLGGDQNALIFSNNNIGELMRMEYGGAIKLNKIMSTTSGSSGGIRVGANSSGYPNITTVNGVELVIRDTDQIRFSDSTAWDYNTWGGIRFHSSSNVMTIGGPSSSAFTSNASPPDITINFDGLSGTNGLTYEGSTIWHAGNDGSGSGLDADLLDGQEGSYYTSFANVTNKTSGTGDFATTGDLQSGKGSGGVALTINDGGGNANITFNHRNRTPEQNGQAARIEVNCDSNTSGGAKMFFELGGATSGVVSTLPTIFELQEDLVIARRDFEVVGDATISGTLTVGGVEVGAGGSTYSATASGAIADGDTVIVNSDGTVSSVAITSQPSSISTQGDLETTYNTFYTSPGLAAGEIDVSGTPQTLFMQTFSGYNNRFQYRFGYVSSGAVTVTGTRGTINSSTTYYGCCAFHPTHDTFLTAYRSSNHYMYVRAIQRSGANGASGATSSATTVETTGYSSYMNMCYHEAADRMILVWRSNSPTTFCRAIEMTGPTTIWSTGSKTTVNSTSGGGSENGIMYDAQEEVVVFAWEEHVGAKGWLRAATVSGSTFTFGSEVNFSDNKKIWTADNYHIAIAGNGQGKFIVCWRDNESTSTNYTKGMATLFSLSGTTITQLGEVVFNAQDTRNINLRYDSVNDNFAVTYKQIVSSTNSGQANTLTISGNSITVGSTERQIGSSDYKNSSLIRLNDMDAHLTTYNNGDNKLRYVTYETESNETNLAANNFIGFADGAASNGATATIKINGAVDDNQTGLTPATKYYVQTDGSLGTGAANPSVYAGLAVASTKIIVKG